MDIMTVVDEEANPPVAAYRRMVGNRPGIWKFVHDFSEKAKLGLSESEIDGIADALSKGDMECYWVKERYCFQLLTDAGEI